MICPLMRLDRSDDRRGGVVALHVSSEFVSKRRTDLESPEFEILWVEVKIKSISLVCAICYRPLCNDVRVNTAFLSNLQICLDKIQLEPNKLIVLLGDFNAHYYSSNFSDLSDYGSSLYCWMECNSLFQAINEPTPQHV